MYRRLIILSMIILLAVCGLAGLGYHAIERWSEGLEWARVGEFAEVAEQIRQDIKRKVDGFMETENNRPYTDYQYYYVPENAPARQAQMPVFRSPLSGNMDNGFAYGSFQIDENGTVITANDDIVLREGWAGNNNIIALENNLNRKNVEYNLLPVLGRGIYDSSAPVAGKKKGVSTEKVKSPSPELPATVINNMDKRYVSKGKGSQRSRGRNLQIEGFQKQGQATQILEQPRAVFNSNISNNSASQSGRQVWMQQGMVNSPAQTASGASREEGELAKADEKQVSDERRASGSDYAGVYERDYKDLDWSIDAGKLNEKLATAQSEGLDEAGQVQVDEEEELFRIMPQEAAPQSQAMQQTAQALKQVKELRQGQQLASHSSSSGEQGQAQEGQWAMPKGSVGPMYVERAVREAERRGETVQVRIEPLVPVVVAGGKAEDSMFEGQVFLLRHVQTGDKHFRQGFQLNENKLIEEVEESARRFMREGMSFGLVKGKDVDLEDVEPGEDIAYRAVLDFGFGQLVLNLMETDPGRIAKEVSQLRYWYFSIIVVVLLAVTLGLGGVWRNARAQLKLAQKKDDFISAVSHELRTPLTSIRMYSEMLERDWVKSKDKLGEYYKSMRQESERLSRLIENVLDFSRIQRGRKKYAFSLGNLNECIADVVEMMAPYAAQHGFVVEAQLGDIGQTAFDSDAVKQIVVNLVDNAVKYARDAEDRTITVRTRTDTRYILIEVEDHGPGVPHMQRKKIFEEFYRTEAEATRETNGTGLGLALVKRFAQAHNGFVEILTAKPAGAIFRVGLAAQV